MGAKASLSRHLQSQKEKYTVQNKNKNGTVAVPALNAALACFHALPATSANAARTEFNTLLFLHHKSFLKPNKHRGIGIKSTAINGQNCPEAAQK